jgi:phosphotransacetylase
MPSIGSATFKFLSGLPAPGGMSLDEITRANADGVSLREIGKRPGPVSLNSFVDIAAANVKTTIESYHALRGTLVTVTDAHGNTWTNVAVLGVELVRDQKVGTLVGGINSGSSVILECVWRVQATTIP